MYVRRMVSDILRALIFVGLASGCAPRSAAFSDGFVAAGNASLHVHCMGTGEPTVLFDAGFLNDGTVWREVQSEVARSTRACVFDRPGLGYSAPPPAGPRSSAVIVAELAAGLHTAKIAGPLVLVGHSFGGLNMQLFAQTRGAAGLVLVDSMSTEQDTRYWSLLPPALRNEFAAEISRSPERIDQAAMLASMAEVRASRKDLGSLPLVVLTHGKPEQWPPGMPESTADAMEQVWSAMQSDMAKLSQNSAHLVEATSGHFLQQDAPKVVVAAIEEVCRSSRSKRKVDAGKIREPR